MTALEQIQRLRRRSSELTGGRADVSVIGDEYGWYVGVAVKPPKQRDRIIRVEADDLDAALRLAVAKVRRVR